jgi:hypothetical protein
MAGAQTRSDYDFAMNKFVKAYNAKDAAAINKMWPVKKRKQLENLFTAQQLEEMQEKYGRINSFKYVGADTSDPDKVIVFKTVFSRVGIKATSLTLEPGNFLGTFRLVTSSPGIAKMQKQATW